MESHDLPFSGLACSSSPLGIAATSISQLAQFTTSDAISQLCDRPSDSMYFVDSDSMVVSMPSELMNLTITMPTNGAAQGSGTCHSALSSIAEECFGAQQVWGGEFYDGDLTYAISKAASADVLVEQLENMYNQETGVPASGFATATVAASGTVSGLPVPSGIPPEYPIENIPLTTPTATVIATGYYPGPVESGFILPGVQSGHVATATPEPHVFPGWIEDSSSNAHRGSGQREELEPEMRPKARWIMG